MGNGMSVDRWHAIRFLLLVIVIGGIWSSGQAQDAASTWELRACAEAENLPFSSQQHVGLGNEVLRILSDQLHARLTYHWLQEPKLRATSQGGLHFLQLGECDVVSNVADGQDPFLTTLAYYQSTYVFVARTDVSFDVESLSLDSDLLRHLRIGVLSSSVPDVALLRRGYRESGALHYALPTAATPTPLLDGVVNKQFDIAIVWGPIAGYYAKTHGVDLDIVPVTPQVDSSGTSMVYAYSFGLRSGDEELRDLLNRAIALRWDDIRDVLKEYNVPIVSLPKPVVTLGGAP